jgi:hypothetical protein
MFQAAQPASQSVECPLSYYEIELKPAMYSFKKLSNITHEYRNTGKTSVNSNLCTYKTFYLGDDTNGTVTGKNVLYVSTHSSNLRISGHANQLWKIH